MIQQQIIFRGIDISAANKERLKERKIFEEASKLITLPNNVNYKGMRQETCEIRTTEKLLSKPSRTYTVLSWGEKEYAIDEKLKTIIAYWQETAGNVFVNLVSDSRGERAIIAKTPLPGAVP